MTHTHTHTDSQGENNTRNTATAVSQACISEGHSVVLCAISTISLYIPNIEEILNATI